MKDPMHPKHFSDDFKRHIVNLYNAGKPKREIRRRTRVVGTFPDGNSALMLVTAKLKYIVEHEWGKRRYLDMSKLEEMDELRERRRARRGRGRGRLNQLTK